MANWALLRVLAGRCGDDRYEDAYVEKGEIVAWNLADMGEWLKRYMKDGIYSVQEVKAEFVSLVESDEFPLEEVERLDKEYKARTAYATAVLFPARQAFRHRNTALDIPLPL